MFAFLTEPPAEVQARSSLTRWRAPRDKVCRRSASPRDHHHPRRRVSSVFSPSSAITPSSTQHASAPSLDASLESDDQGTPDRVADRWCAGVCCGAAADSYDILSIRGETLSHDQHEPLAVASPPGGWRRRLRRLWASIRWESFLDVSILVPCSSRRSSLRQAAQQPALRRNASMTALSEGTQEAT